MFKAVDEYDEDFEAYEDDFEEAAESPKHAAPSSSQAKEAAPTTRRDESKGASSSDSKTVAADSKDDSKSTLNNTDTYTNTANASPDNKAKDLSLLKSKKTKKFGSSSISLAGGALSGMGARSKRLTRLLSSGVLDLQDEKFNQLNIVPSSKYDVYQRALHGAGAPVRQVGVPTDEASRDVLCGTDPIVMVDKEMQFSYGDDTALLNIMRVIQNRGRGGGSSGGGGVSVLQEAGVTPSTGSPSGGEGDAAGTSLVRFLQQSSQLCLALLGEQHGVARDRKRPGESNVGSVDGTMLFAAGSKWELLGQAAVNGANELVRTRRIGCVKFSSLQPHVLMSTHPPPSSSEDPEGEDLRPLKGLYCLWDTGVPGQPSFILEASGSPSCCSPSSTQSYIFAAGTAEGSVHLWDLREESSLHRDSDSIDLGIDRGIRRPCYSAHLALTAGGDVDAEQHSAGVLQIEALGESTSHDAGISQFVTLDAEGTIALWATANIDAARPPASDFGLSPWSVVRLLHMRSLRISAGITTSPSMSVLATVPGDASLLLASVGLGRVRKISRYGDASAPLNLSRSAVGTNNHYCSAVTCISVRPKWSPLVLVGREDGSIDLFSLHKEAPLASWTMSHHHAEGSSALRAPSSPVVALQWCSEHSSTFLACDAGGLCQLFDLRLRPDAPLCSERISIKANTLRAKAIDFSQLRPGGRVMRAAAVIGSAIAVAALSEELFVSTYGEGEEAELQSAMDEWMALRVVGGTADSGHDVRVAAHK